MTQLVGEWATVKALSDGLVDLVVDRFSTKLVYASVAYTTAGGGDPAAGDVAFLHYDSSGQPAYAVVWAS